MHRLSRSKSGREIYGSKWQNMEGTTSDGPNHDSIADETTDTNAVDMEDPTKSLEGHKSKIKPSTGINERLIISQQHQSMYNACIEGDYSAMEVLLEEDPNLGRDEISEEGDKALHVAASMNHKQVVQKLVEILSPSEIALLDGHGYTACCYAAMSDAVEIADLLIRKNPNIATARDRESKMPLQKAAERGNAKMVSYLLTFTKVQDLSRNEWFDILLATIRCKTYGVALEILGIDEELATMSNAEGTALHLLAAQSFYLTVWEKSNGVMRGDMRLLARKLLDCIQKLAQSIELMKNPPILHHAAERGNVELITMLTQTYPHLIWHTNNAGHTIFHIAVIHGQETVFRLINQIGARKDLIAASQDRNGNNILHLIGESEATRWWTPQMPVFEMQRRMLWFKEVKKIVPPLCWGMKNKQGETAKELFVKRHKKLLEESRTWTRNVSDSCMLVSTLIFTMVFGASYAVPGGYNQDSGVPILLGTTKWFTSFIISEGAAMLSSALSILCFLNIMLSPMKEDDFLRQVPNLIVLGLNALWISGFGALSALISTYLMVYDEVKASFGPPVMRTLVVVVYIVSILFICNRIYNWSLVPEYVFWKQSRHRLFKKDSKYRSWAFSNILWPKIGSKKGEVGHGLSVLPQREFRTWQT